MPAESPSVDAQSQPGAAHHPNDTYDADVIVIGSGFGGSTAALRLTEKNYRVLVLEAGRDFADTDLPKTSWNMRKYLWAPQIGCYGIQRIHLLPHVLVMAAAGVGGGSLNYANTLYQPTDDFFNDPQWAGITDWAAELAPHYDQASRMLGRATNPHHTPADQVLLNIATDLGVSDTFRRTPVGVHFGPNPSATPQPGAPITTHPDPYFGGAGPARQACTACGSCMSGCRVGAKNTLVKNYLYLARQAGAQVRALTMVHGLQFTPGQGWSVHTHRSGAWFRGRSTRTFTAPQVVVAAGTYGTQRLLHAMKSDGALPHISDRLGHQTRTNSEAVLAATARRVTTPYNTGVAITSSIHIDEHTHIEPVRYGPGSNAIGLLQTILVDGDVDASGEAASAAVARPRWGRALRQALRHPMPFLRSLWIYRWSERTVIALVMQDHDNALTLSAKRTRWGRHTLTSRSDAAKPAPTWIPAGHDVARRIATQIQGDPGGAMTEWANIPMTAHFLGGCVIGATAQDGVLDAYQRVFGYPTLTVADGSAVSANLGVNPSLTITAQAERVFSLWPNRGDADPRPQQGEPYRKLSPVAPASPTVPAQAPSALR